MTIDATGAVSVMNALAIDLAIGPEAGVVGQERPRGGSDAVITQAWDSRPKVEAQWSQSRPPDLSLRG